MCVSHAAEVNRELLTFLGRPPPRPRHRHRSATTSLPPTGALPCPFIRASCSSPPPRSSLTPPRVPVSLRARARRRPQGPRRPASRAGRQAARRRGVDHRPRGRRRRPRADRPAARDERHAAGHRLHARRRLDPRQRRHARPARPRARRRRPRRGRVRRVHALARGALPGRDRAGLRHRPVDHPRGRGTRAGRIAGWQSPANRSAAT